MLMSYEHSKHKNTVNYYDVWINQRWIFQDLSIIDRFVSMQVTWLHSPYIHHKWIEGFNDIVHNNKLTRGLCGIVDTHLRTRSPWFKHKLNYCLHHGVSVTGAVSSNAEVNSEDASSNYFTGGDRAPASERCKITHHSIRQFTSWGLSHLTTQVI